MPQKGSLQLTKSGAETDIVRKVFDTTDLQSISKNTNKRIYLVGFIDSGSKASYVGVSREDANNLLQESLKSRRRREKQDFKYKTEVIVHAFGILVKTIWKTLKGDVS